MMHGQPNIKSGQSS